MTHNEKLTSHNNEKCFYTNDFTSHNEKLSHNIDFKSHNNQKLSHYYKNLIVITLVICLLVHKPLLFMFLFL